MKITSCVGWVCVLGGDPGDGSREAVNSLLGAHMDSGSATQHRCEHRSSIFGKEILRGKKKKHIGLGLSTKHRV